MTPTASIMDSLTKILWPWIMNSEGYFNLSLRPRRFITLQLLFLLDIKFVNFPWIYSLSSWSFLSNMSFVFDSPKYSRGLVGFIFRGDSDWFWFCLSLLNYWRVLYEPKYGRLASMILSLISLAEASPVAVAKYGLHRQVLVCLILYSFFIN